MTRRLMWARPVRAFAVRRLSGALLAAGLLAGWVFGALLASPIAAQTLPSPDDARALIEGPQSDADGEWAGHSLRELMTALGVPGVGIAVISDYEVAWAHGYGVADVETGAPVDVETMFQAASISKPVAAMGTMVAVQEGVFGLDDDVNDILTSWRLDGDGFTDERPVTPRMLTSHTSGLGDGFGFPGYDPGTPLPTTVQILEGHDRSNVGVVFMERPPMTAYEYSGGGVTLMELALSDARGRPFEAVMDDDVLGPLGMTRSSYRQPISAEHDRNAARAHGREGESMGAKWHVYPERAAAGLWTTPTDLARFAIDVQRAYRGDDDTVLTQQHVQEMLSPVGVGDFAVGFTMQKRGQGWYFSHGGSNWGFRAFLIAHKAAGYGVVIMTNASRGSELAQEVVRRVERVYAWDSVADPVQRGYRR